MFNGGNKVLLLGMSNDPDTTLASWAREKSYPGVFTSDSTLAVSKLYGSVRGTTTQTSARNVFVIGPDGRITYRVLGFNVTSEQAYADLAKAVDQAAGVSSP
jgi:peroxiredoxin